MSTSGAQHGATLAAVSPPGSFDAPHPEKAAPRRTRTRIRILAVAAAAAFVVLALALGLGLGLGLRKHHHAASASAPAPSSSANATLTPLSELVNATQFMLDPAFDVSATPTTRVYNWTITQILGAPMGVAKAMLVINGISPGPIIEANSGDRIIVNVNNGLSNTSNTSTAIHWHGLYQNGTSWYDGTSGVTQCGILPGQTLTYNFTLDGGWTGTTWWHAHYSTQYTDGLYGPIVVHSPTESVPASSRSAVITLSDAYNTPSAALLAAYLADDSDEPANEPVPDGALVNGVGQFGLCAEYPDQACDPASVYFNFTFEADTTYRLRLINTGSFAGIRFSVDGHALTVVEIDGTAVRPVQVAGLELQVAQRASVLLTTDQAPGAYWVRAQMDTSMFTAVNPGQNANQLAVLRYPSSISLATLPTLPSNSSDPGPGSDLPDLTDAMLVPADALDAPDAVARVPVSFSIQRTSDQNWRAFMNATSWAPPAGGQATLFAGVATGAAQGVSQVYPGSQLITTFDELAPVDIIINNIDDGDHPFHLHGHKPWLVGAGAGEYTGAALNTTNPMRRDTFLVPAFTWLAIRFWADHAGYWALHCHIAWHMAGGGLMQVATLPARLGAQTLPPDMVAQCAAQADAAGTGGAPGLG